MRSIKTILAGLVLAALFAPGVYAGTDLNEVGALLVYPTIIASAEGNDATATTSGGIETFVTITNAGPLPVVAHVSYVNGDWRDEGQYCYECDFEIPLSGNDTETLVITPYGPSGTRIVAEDLYLDLSCPWKVGMLVVALEGTGNETLTDNVLLGEEVVVDYSEGMAFSIPAIPFQGMNGNGDREYNFDDSEYAMMPRIVAADFLAPNINETGTAYLSLFTLGFERQFPPLVDCSVTGFDAEEHPFSASFQFGCWTMFNLCDITPEFCYPNLGLFNEDPDGIGPNTHGWLQLNCRVDIDPTLGDGFDAEGGVHGAILQHQKIGSRLAAGSGENFYTAAWWGRLLYQSVTTGDAVTLILEGTSPGMD